MNHLLAYNEIIKKTFIRIMYKKKIIETSMRYTYFIHHLLLLTSL
jgi:hypothetical protein